MPPSKTNCIVDSKTRLCCLIGDPVIQSPSPEMHNFAFQSADLNYVYLAFRVPAKQLSEAVKGLRAINARGFNITIPHKQSVVKLLDDLDELAANLGAVNTVVNENGRLLGTNTDVEGFIRPLLERERSLNDRRVIILGAGGAARACIAGLIQERCTDLVILNRSVDRAEHMVSDMQRKFTFNAEVAKLDEASLKKKIGSRNLIVNTTPIGMYPNLGESPVPRNLIQKDQIIYDIVYKPVKTKLIRYAEDAGATVVYGYEMLVEQAAKAFSLWTGSESPKNSMKRIVLQRLESS
ncbi:MAG: shikimate dehydrogenase [Thaumarchaeota archaeon]|nr:shikimate dehydrogenase [Nitrososphaerota archaeon]MCL5318728.1 shikimate dehydrogenase [Nitrososphaerota archaeon]